DQELYFHFLVADYAGGTLKENTENDGELKWLTPQEIAKLDNLLGEIKEVLPHIFGKSNKVVSYKVVYEKGNTMSTFILET
ncbi:MAG: hypothetical protein Q7S61_02080, partial [bacterium]|nr:hypothetical protein [bacterium]